MSKIKVRSTWFPWVSAFVVLKVWGTGVAAWSWWWLLAAEVPVLWLMARRVGLIP